MTKVDVFIPTAYKDYPKVNFVINSIIKYIPEANDFYVSLPAKENIQNTEILGHKIYFFNDFEILPNANLSLCQFRPNWIFQQLLKLCQRKTKTEYTFICDSDIIFTNKFELFKDSKPILYCKTNDKDEPAYFKSISLISHEDLIKYSFCENKICLKTEYISDLMLFKNDIIDDMFKRYEFTIDSFVEFVLKMTHWDGDKKTGIFISEYELYGRYIDKYFNDLYVKKDFNPYLIERNQLSAQEIHFLPDEIEKILNSEVAKNFNAVKLQSGCCASNIFYEKIKQ